MRQILATVFRGSFCTLLAIAGMSGTWTTAGDWTLNDALKQIDKATQGLRGLTGKVTLTDQQHGAEAATMEATVSILTDGRMRFEQEGDDGRTVLSITGKLYVYEAAIRSVTEYPLAKHPERLAQYTSVGFAKRGSALKSEYVLTLVGDEELDSHKVLLFELTPKSDRLRETVSKIHLWIDQANWLPIQQRIFHGGTDTHLTVRYADLSRNDKLSAEPFQPKWPKGTQKLKPE